MYTGIISTTQQYETKLEEMVEECIFTEEMKETIFLNYLNLVNLDRDSYERAL